MRSTHSLIVALLLALFSLPVLAPVFSAPSTRATSIYLGKVVVSSDFPRGVMVLNASRSAIDIAIYGLDYTPEPNEFEIRVYRLDLALGKISKLAEFNEVVGGGYGPATTMIPGSAIGLDQYAGIVVADKRPYGEPPASVLKIYGFKWNSSTREIRVEEIGSINFATPVMALEAYPGLRRGEIIVHYLSYTSFKEGNNWEAKPGLVVYNITSRKIEAKTTMPYILQRKDRYYYLYDSNHTLLGSKRIFLLLAPCHLAGSTPLYAAIYKKGSIVKIEARKIFFGEQNFSAKPEVKTTMPGEGPFTAYDPLYPALYVMTITGGEKVDLHTFRCTNNTILQHSSKTIKIGYYDRVTIAAYQDTPLVLVQKLGVIYAYTYSKEYKLLSYTERFSARLSGFNNTIVAGIGHGAASPKIHIVVINPPTIQAPPSTTTTTTSQTTTTPATTTTTTTTKTTTTTTTTKTSETTTTTATKPATTKTTTTTTQTTKPQIAIKPGDWLKYHVVVEAKSPEKSMRVELDAKATLKASLIGLQLVVSTSKKLSEQERALAALGALTGNELFISIAAGQPLPIPFKAEKTPDPSCPLVIEPPGKLLAKTYNKEVKGYSAKITCKYTSKGVLGEMTVELKGKGREGLARAVLVDASRDVGINEVKAGGGPLPGIPLSTLVLAIIVAVVVVVVIVVIILAKKR